jgi:hypothetical protein
MMVEMREAIFYLPIIKFPSLIIRYYLPRLPKYYYPSGCYANNLKSGQRA